MSWWNGLGPRLAICSAAWMVALSVVAPATAQAPSGEVQATAVTPWRFGVVGFYNPRLMVLRYQPLVDYLSESTGHPWQLEVSTGYQQTVDALCRGDLQLAYLGPYTYVRARSQCQAEPVARLQTGGADTFRSVIMVRSDSTLTTLAELRGGRFGFGATLSTSSHLVPLAMLRDAGLSDGDFTCFLYGHHERAARAVLLGEVDACGVRDVVGDRFAERGLRILAWSDPIPNFPLVMPPASNPEFRHMIEKALIEDPRRDPAALSFIASLDPELADGFAGCRDAEYDGLRKLATRILGPNAMTIGEQALITREGCIER